MHFDQKKTYISVEPSIGVLDMLIFILFILDARVFGPFHVYIHVLRLGAEYDAGTGCWVWCWVCIGVYVLTKVTYFSYMPLKNKTWQS
jgi:hypothetical protein